MLPSILIIYEELHKFSNTKSALYDFIINVCLFHKKYSHLNVWHSL